MKPDNKVYCIKSNFIFYKNYTYTYKKMIPDKYDDPLDPLLYNIYNKEVNQSIPYRKSAFPKYFILPQELRKQKLKQIEKNN